MLDELGAAEVSKWAGVDGCAIAEDGDLVADGAQFFKAVGDVDDAGAAFLEGLDNLEDFAGFGFAEAGGGLIKDDEGSVAGDGAANFNQLSTGGAKALDTPIRPEGEAVRFNEAGGALHHGGTLDRTEGPEIFPAEEDVLANA